MYGPILGPGELTFSWSSSGRTRISSPLMRSVFDIQVGDKARVYLGCDKTFATCIARFDNALNFRGEPHIPGIDSLISYPDAR